MNEYPVRGLAFTPPVGLPPHHLCVCAADNKELRRHVLFRDYLRNHPGEAKVYGELKMDLTQDFVRDRVSYTNGKSEFVNQRLEVAGWKG